MVGTATIKRIAFCLRASLNLLGKTLRGQNHKAFL
jgi:hypothetical protein